MSSRASDSSVYSDSGSGSDSSSSDVEQEEEYESESGWQEKVPLANGHHTYEHDEHEEQEEQENLKADVSQGNGNGTSTRDKGKGKVKAHTAAGPPSPTVYAAPRRSPSPTSAQGRHRPSSWTDLNLSIVLALVSPVGHWLTGSDHVKHLCLLLLLVYYLHQLIEGLQLLMNDGRDVLVQKANADEYAFFPLFFSYSAVAVVPQIQSTPDLIELKTPSRRQRRRTKRT